MKTLPNFRAVSETVCPVSETGFNNLCRSKGAHPLSSDNLCGFEGTNHLSNNKKRKISEETTTPSTSSFAKDNNNENDDKKKKIKTSNRSILKSIIAKPFSQSDASRSRNNEKNRKLGYSRTDVDDSAGSSCDDKIDLLKFDNHESKIENNNNFND